MTGRHSLPDQPDDPEVVPSMFTRDFWLSAAERSSKSAAQALVVLWGAGTLNLLTIDWRVALGVAAGQAVLSLATSVASAPFGDKGTASLLPGGD